MGKVGAWLNAIRYITVRQECKLIGPDCNVEGWVHFFLIVEIKKKILMGKGRTNGDLICGISDELESFAEICKNSQCKPGVERLSGWKRSNQNGTWNVLRVVPKQPSEASSTHNLWMKPAYFQFLYWKHDIIKIRNRFAKKKKKKKKTMTRRLI